VLILASDGLWEVLSQEEAVGLVADTVKDPDMCAKRLATEAMTRGSRDNITALVAFLQVGGRRLRGGCCWACAGKAPASLAASLQPATS
jgi:serine/threonine protein phosphatase PrpC